MDEDLSLAQVSPLLKENHFHLLSNMDGEEDVRWIAAVALPLVISLPLALA